MMSDPDAGDDATDTAVCPECENEYVSLGRYWARSQTCDYPVPALDDLAMLDGLMVVGGALNNRQRSLPSLAIERVSRRAAC
jgi:hypothetical protein